VSEAVEAVQQQARLAGVTLRVELAEEPAYIEGDAFGLARVYGNLLMNAVQATTPGGSIVVATAVTDEQVTVAVQDTGHGIPQDRLAGVFDDFVTTKRGGLGLGLAVSRRIVEQLDGRITVTSEEGKGATFGRCWWPGKEGICSPRRPTKSHAQIRRCAHVPQGNQSHRD
jgi:signal transduction histidine kinase